jgi:predicted HTH domain antitoxin
MGIMKKTEIPPKKGFSAKVKEDILKKYAEGKISMGKLSQQLKISIWDSFELLKQENKNLNVSLEDYLKASDIDS